MDLETEIELDSVLTIIINQNRITAKEIYFKLESIGKGTMSTDKCLEQLNTDGYITVTPHGNYSSTKSGERLFKNGGYTQQNENTRVHEEREKSTLSYAKKAYRVALISIAITVLFEVCHAFKTRPDALNSSQTQTSIKQHF